MEGLEEQENYDYSFHLPEVIKMRNDKFSADKYSAQ